MPMTVDVLTMGGAEDYPRIYQEESDSKLCDPQESNIIADLRMELQAAEEWAGETIPELNRIRSDAESHLAECKALKEQLREVNQKNEEYQNNETQSKKMIDELNTKVKKQDSELQQIKKSFEDEKKSKSNNAGKQDEAVSVLQKKLLEQEKKLEKEKKEMEIKIEKLENEQKDGEINKKKEIENIKQKTQQETRTAVTKELKVKEEEASKKLQVLDTEFRQAQVKWEKKEKEMQDELEKSQKETERLRAECDEISTDLDKAKSKKTAEEEKKEKTNRERDLMKQLEETRVELEKKILRKNEEIKTLKIEKSSVEDSLKASESGLGDVNRQYKKLEKKLSIMESEQWNRSSKTSAIFEETEKEIRKRLQAEFSVKMSDLQRILKDSESEIHTLRSKLSNVEKANKQQKKTVNKKGSIEKSNSQPFNLPVDDREPVVKSGLMNHPAILKVKHVMKARRADIICVSVLLIILSNILFPQFWSTSSNGFANKNGFSSTDKVKMNYHGAKRRY